jgi:hypothetical protein
VALINVLLRVVVVPLVHLLFALLLVVGAALDEIWANRRAILAVGSLLVGAGWLVRTAT